MKSLNSKKGLAEKPDTVIESTQIGASQDCWGCGCCFFQPFKGCLQRAKRIFDDCCKPNPNGIQIHSNSEGTQKVVEIDGFGTRVFGDNTENVFLDPDKIDSEKIAYFIKQLIEVYDKNTSDENTSHKLSVFNKLCSDKENMKFTALSASAGSLLVLSSFLKNQNATEKTIFFQEVVEKLFPLADGEQRLEEQRSELENNAQKLMEYIAKEVNFVNPSGILFHAGLPKCFDLKLQSLAVVKQRLASEGYFIKMISEYLSLASEQYFIKMISEYLSGGFELVYSYGCHMNPYMDSYMLNNCKNALISSVADEIVFPFYYVAMFADDLKTYNLGDEKISKFVYKVMQYGDIVKKEDGTFELDYFCHGLIDELELPDDKHKGKVSDMAKKYLNIRDDYLALVKKDFVKSAKAFHETFLKNREQEYSAPHGIARVFDLWVAIFHSELKGYNLGDEKISKFVYKVMKHGKIVKKEDGKFELGGFCLGFIDELKLSDDQRKEVSDIVKKYLNIRDDYLVLKKTYCRDLQKECPTDLGEINEQVIANNKQVEENFFNSVEALHKTLLQNFKQEYSSTPGGISRVFYVCAAIFRNELKEYNLNDKQIYKFLDKVMYNDKLAINELNLSDDQRKEFSDIVKEYLKIRDGWQDWHKTYLRNCWQEERPTNLCEIEEKFFNSVEAFHETLLQNFQQEYRAPRGIARDFDSANLGEVEKPSANVSSAYYLSDLFSKFSLRNWGGYIR